MPAKKKVNGGKKKGKSSNPLKIIVTDSRTLEHPSIQALIPAGHTITHSCESADLVIGENACYLSKEMLEKKGVLDILIKAGRARKSIKKKKLEQDLWEGDD